MAAASHGRRGLRRSEKLLKAVALKKNNKRPRGACWCFLAETRAKTARRTGDNATSEFVKREILLRVGRAECDLNPHLFAKGRWKETRERRLPFTTRIRYSAERGRTIETTLD
jgi:hypothetical protein